MLAALVLLTLLDLPTGNDARAGEPLRVAAAASSHAALTEVARAFEISEGTSVEVVSGSTGKLYAQIVNGAPYDLFFAADQERPRRLVARGDADRVVLYAYGRLVFWAAGREDWKGRPLREVLLDPELRRVALANPRVAPYGAAASEALKKLGSPVPEGRLVFGENVSQALQLVATGAADGGFVALSQVSHGPLQRAAQIWNVDGGALTTPLAHGAVRLRRSRHPAADRFLSYVESPEGRAILNRHGLPATAEGP